ncbi:hypothetical protein AB0929_00355 [Streptomyces massasporeus]|uniref:hypothetical protein n=1 Tax=Streptomyces massasporeus TaxID=67324 RepID=UPI00345439AF
MAPRPKPPPPPPPALPGADRAVLAAALTAAALASGAALYGTQHGATKSPAASPRPTTPTVAKGYHLVHEKKLGISFPVPDDWTARERTAEQITYADPSGLAGITIGTVAPAGVNSPPPSGSSRSRAGPARSGPSISATAARAVASTTSTCPRRRRNGTPTAPSSTRSGTASGRTEPCAPGARRTPGP